MLNFNLYTGIQIMIFIQLSFNIILYNTILGTPVSSTIINWPTRYNWNIVEGGVKHHNPNPNPLVICVVNQSYINSVVFRNDVILLRPLFYSFKLDLNIYQSSSWVVTSSVTTSGLLVRRKSTTCVVNWLNKSFILSLTSQPSVLNGSSGNGALYTNAPMTIQNIKTVPIITPTVAPLKK